MSNTTVQQIGALSAGYESLQKSMSRVESDIAEIKMALGVMASHQVETRIADIAEAMNEIRSGLRDLKDTETRSIASAAEIKELDKRVAVLEADKARREGAALLVRVLWTVLGGSGLVTVVAALVTYYKG